MEKMREIIQSCTLLPGLKHEGENSDLEKGGRKKERAAMRQPLQANHNQIESSSYDSR